MLCTILHDLARQKNDSLTFQMTFEQTYTEQVWHNIGPENV